MEKASLFSKVFLPIGIRLYFVSIGHQFVGLILFHESRKNICGDSAPDKRLAERVFEVGSLQIIIAKQLFRTSAASQSIALLLTVQTP